MPVLFVRGDVDGVAGLYLLDFFAFFLDAARAGDDVEDLAFRVRVPAGAGSGLEEDAEPIRLPAVERRSRPSRRCR